MKQHTLRLVLLSTWVLAVTVSTGCDEETPGVLPDATVADTALLDSGVTEVDGTLEVAADVAAPDAVPADGPIDWGDDPGEPDATDVPVGDTPAETVVDVGSAETAMDLPPEMAPETAPETTPEDVLAETEPADAAVEVVADVPMEAGPADGGPDTGPDVVMDTAGPDVGSPASCPPAAAGMPEEAAAALNLANSYRAAMGIPCATLDDAINTAAELHCDYYAANSGACTANAHKEVEGCALYVAANFWERMSAAGYTGNAVFENMAFSNDGASSTQQWVDSVWHRTPVLSPWVRHIGYGGASGCDTMDFGRGPDTPNDVVGVYPYDGQTAVPVSFNGLYEGPTPPAPPNGWPSGYVVHIYAKGATITSHTIEVEGSGQSLDHVWISPDDSQLLSDEHVMYPHEPMASQTTYRVTVNGTYVGGTLDLSWTFTTE